MSKEYLMALDAGSGSGRCLLVSVDGTEIFHTAREWTYQPAHEAGAMGCAFDPEQFWAILAATAREALIRAGIRGDQVVGVSSTSQREGCVFLDDRGHELYAGPNRDFRAVVEGKEIAGTFGDEIYRRTGHYPSGLFAPARLLWHKRQASELYAKIARVLMINDWILFRLSGEVAMEPSNASETCLFDLENRNWADDLMDALEIPSTIFPPILPSGSRLGRVTERAAAETGLIAGTPVIIGGADTQCGLLGCGAIRDGDLAAVCGTTTPVQLVTKQPMIDRRERTWAGAHVVPGSFVLESNAGGSGSIYRWFRDLFREGDDECDGDSGATAFERMNRAATAAVPGAEGVQSFVSVSVMNAKDLVPTANVLALGLAPFQADGQQTRGLIFRAVLESLAYAIKANTAQIVDVSGRSPEGLRICGGLANSSLYREILANVMGTSVQAFRFKEGSGIGTAILAGIGSGIYRDAAEGVAVLVQPEDVVIPRPDLRDAYAALYDRWNSARQNLASLG